MRETPTRLDKPGTADAARKGEPVDRRRFVTGLLGTSLAAAPLYALGARTIAKPARPNVIFILTDDLGGADLGCYGNRFHETPNIDRLSREGMLFQNAYSASPVCSPSRAAIMTGNHPGRLHLTNWLPGNEPPDDAKMRIPEWNRYLTKPTIAEKLKEANYTSTCIGKWHLWGADYDLRYYPDKMGFENSMGATYKGQPPGKIVPPEDFSMHFYPYTFGLHPPIPRHFDVPNGTEGEYLTDRLTEEALGVIERETRQGNPFCLFLSHHAPHVPLEAKREKIEKYEKKKAQAGSNHHPVYAAMIESIDESVGRVMAKVDELGIADETIIIFTSDNGGELVAGATTNAPLRDGKMSLYEGGIRVPLIIRAKGIPQGSICQEPVIGTDLFPTMCELAGLPQSAMDSSDGESLVPLLWQQTSFEREAIYWHYPHYIMGHTSPCGAVRKGKWKLIEFFEDEHAELYNLEYDIGESVNLVYRERQKAAELRDLVTDWRRQVGAQMPIPIF